MSAVLLYVIAARALVRGVLEIAKRPAAHRVGQSVATACLASFEMLQRAE